METSKSDIRTLKSDIEVIKSNYATKQDIEIIKTEVQKAISTQTKWLMATIFVVLGAGITIAKLLF
nr:hemolysin XhlA [Providencia stuartii]